MAEKNSSAVGGVDKIAHPRVRGVDILRDPLLNKVSFYYWFWGNLNLWQNFPSLRLSYKRNVPKVDLLTNVNW